VVLHEVSLDQGAAIDSQQTDRGGRYVLRAQNVDTTASYLVSVGHQGIGYFGEPFAATEVSGDSLPTLFVYDTSSTAPPIRLAERHILVRNPAEDGSRRVIELLVLANRGAMTRTAPDSLTPVWRWSLPPDALQFEVGMSDMAAAAILWRDNVVEVVAPIPPGERELLVSYLVGPSVRAWRVPIDQEVDQLSVLLEDNAATVTGGSLSLRGVEELEGTALRRFGADSVAAGVPVEIRFPPRVRTGSLLLWILVPLVTLTLTVGFYRWWRRQQEQTTRRDDPMQLAAEIAALDAADTGREDETYRRRRAELKERLNAALDERAQRG
jgi:hypothetical protein